MNQRLSSVVCVFTDKPALQQQYLDLYNNNTFDIMIMPTTPSTAPPIYSVEPYMLYNGKYVSDSKLKILSEKLKTQR